MRTSERVAELRAIVRLMSDGTLRLAIRVDRNHVTALRSDRKIRSRPGFTRISTVLQEVHNAVTGELAVAVMQGMPVAVRALGLAVDPVTGEER